MSFGIRPFGIAPFGILDVPAPTITGSVVQTQADNTLSSTATVRVTGSVVQTQADETLSATGTVKVTGSVVQTQADETLLSAAVALIRGSVIQVQDDEMLVASGTNSTPPTPVPILPQAAGFDAGPGFGKWYNLAYRAGTVSRGPLGPIGRQIAAEVARREAPETPDEVVERAIERLAEREPETEGVAFEVIAEQEALYRALLGEGVATITDVRGAFIEAIARQAREALEARFRRDDEAFVAILSVMW